MKRAAETAWWVAFVGFVVAGLASWNPPPLGAVLLLAGCVCAANSYLSRLPPR